MSVWDELASMAEAARAYGVALEDEATALRAQVTEMGISLADLQRQLAECREPASRVLVGANTDPAAASLRAQLGDLIAVDRIFRGPSAPPAPYSDVGLSLEQGRKVYLSCKSVDIARSIAEEYGSEVDRNLVPLILIEHHEPEDETSQGVTPAEFKREQIEAAEAIDGKVPFYLCLMSSTFNGSAGGPEAWWTDGIYDGIAVDGYLRAWPWNPRGFEYTFENALAFARSKGLPLAITEVGALSKINTTVIPEQAQADAIDQLAEIVQANRDMIEAVCWWENQVQKSGTTRDYRIASRPLALEAYRLLAEALSG